MECPHLCDSVKLNRDFIKNKKCELSTLIAVHTTTSNTTDSATTSPTTLSPAPSSSSSTSSSSTTSTSNNKLWKCLGMHIDILRNVMRANLNH